jgi:hypothetical protein
MNGVSWIGVYPGLDKPQLDCVLNVFRYFVREKKHAA